MWLTYNTYYSRWGNLYCGLYASVQMHLCKVIVVASAGNATVQVALAVIPLYHAHNSYCNNNGDITDDYDSMCNNYVRE